MMTTTPRATAATSPLSIPTTCGADPLKVTNALVKGLLPELDTVALKLPLGCAAEVAAGGAVVPAAGGATGEAGGGAGGGGAAEEVPPGCKIESTLGTVTPTLWHANAEYAYAFCASVGEQLESMQ